MTQNDIFAAMSEALSPYVITQIVELADCYVVSIRNYDGEILMQPPYSVSKDGSKVGFYNMLGKGNIEKFKSGNVIYDDPTFRKVSSSFNKDGGPGSGNHGHKGVPGQVGGSAPSSGITTSMRSARTLTSIKSPYEADIKKAFEDYSPLDVIFKYSDAISEAEDAGNKQKARELRNNANAENQNELGERLKKLGTYMNPGYYVDARFADDVDADVYSRETVNVQSGCFNMQPVTSSNSTDASPATSLADKWVKVSKAEVDARILGQAQKYGMDITLGGINRSEEKAVKTYTYAGAASSELRKGGDNDQSRLIKNMLDRTASPERTVFRGVSGEYARKLSEMKIGDTTVEKGFASTSCDENVAKKFSGNDGVTMKISVPSGIGKSISVGYLSLKPEEQEVLLNSNAQLKLVKKNGRQLEFVASWGEQHNDGGPGSGNFNHEGRPGEVGGSAPNGSADSTASVQRLSSLKDGFSTLTPKQQFAFLKKTGVIPAGELESLGNGAKNGDKAAIEKLKSYTDDYFKKAELGRTVKSLECPGRDKIVKMSPKERFDWILNSGTRKLSEDESWANQNSFAQRVAIDMGMTGTPQVVSQEDFDRYVKETGAPVCYRGVDDNGPISGDNIIYQMAYDDKTYFGTGAYGDGLYFSTRKSTADSYALGSGAVATCAIRPDAKIVDSDSQELEDRVAEFTWSIFDQGAIALSCGYDAIRVKFGDGEAYYVVLNRAALVMADPADKLTGTALKTIDRAKNNGTVSAKPASVQIKDAAAACQSIDKISEKVIASGEDVSSPKVVSSAAKAILKENGFDGLPKTVDSNGFENTESDYPAMYIGASSKTGAENLINGELEIADGSSGYGIHATQSEKSAQRSAGNDGKILSVKLMKGSKVITDEALACEYNKFLEIDSKSSNSDAQKLYYTLSGNPGCIAASLGYDAIYGKSVGRLNVLNRSRLVIQT